jgi:hypothetical protein
MKKEEILLYDRNGRLIGYASSYGAHSTGLSFSRMQMAMS